MPPPDAHPLGALVADFTAAAGRIEGAVNRLATSNAAELDELRRRARTERRILYAAGVGAIVVLVAVAVLMAVTVGFVARLARLEESGRDERDLIVECTAPSVDVDDPHECYEDQQARSGVFIAGMVGGFYDALIVAVPDRADAITAARDAFLESLTATPTTGPP